MKYTAVKVDDAERKGVLENMTSEQKKIDSEFYKFKWYKREADNYAVCTVAYNSVSKSERVKTSTGNKNEQLIIRAIYNQELMQSWCLVFEKTLEKFKWEDKDKLISKRYIDRKSIWRTCHEIGISRSTYFYWLDEILETGLNWAKEFKLM